MPLTTDERIAALRPQLVRFFRRRLSRHCEYAEDLAQETVLASLESSRAAAGRVRSVERWTFRIADRVSANFLRRLYRSPECSLLFQWLPSPPSPHLRPHRGSTGHARDPRLLNAALERLDSRTRTVVLLHSTGNKPVRISARLGISPTQVSRLLYRGVRRLRRELGQSPPD